MGSPFGGSYVSAEVRIRDDGLLEVRLDAGAPAAVRRDELDLDARAVLLVPVDASRRSTTSGWLRLVSMRSSIWNAGRPLPVFDVMTTGLPVVSWP